MKMDNLFKKIFYSILIYISSILIVMFFAGNVYLLNEMQYQKYKTQPTFEGLQIGSMKINSHYIALKTDEGYILKNIKFDNFLLIILSIILLESVIWLYYVYKVIKDNEEEKCIFKRTNLEAMATQNSMSILTENIHHELNSPLKVAESKYKNLKCLVLFYISKYYFGHFNDDEERIKNELKEKDIKIQFKNGVLTPDKLFENFELLETSTEQIKSVLNNMASFKQLRYSNGNKTIFDLIDGASKIMRVIIDHPFKLEIDEKLKNYKIDHISGLKNADFLNIILNHFKNSIEANATELKVFKENLKGRHILINIKDNGNGIPDEFKEQIFLPDKSSKQDSIGLRGNGLFLNQKLLELFDGDIRLKRSIVGEGTEFVLKIPTLKIQKEEENELNSAQ